MQTIDATSIGTVAMHLQTSVQNIERIVGKLKLEPVLILNHVRHFSNEQVEAIRAKLNKSKP